VTDIDPDDVAAMRRENGGKDFRLFLRQQIAEGQARRATPDKPAPPPKPPGYRPGAWPSGTSPPGPVRNQHTAAAWTAALDEYRDWLTTTDHPELDNPTAHRQQCACPACTPTQTEENQ
jgi:hypothetical protein